MQGAGIVNSVRSPAKNMFVSVVKEEIVHLVPAMDVLCIPAAISRSTSTITCEQK